MVPQMALKHEIFLQNCCCKTAAGYLQYKPVGSKPILIRSRIKLQEKKAKIEELEIQKIQKIILSTRFWTSVEFENI